MQAFIASLRITAATMLMCVGGYTLVILGIAQLVTPESANGSLVRRADGSVAGSRLIAQKFEQPGYFWPRPSACGYNAAGAAGSNKSPTSPDLTARATELAARHSATGDRPLPADLAAASGAGLDPHITEKAALFQAERVAAARGIPAEQLKSLIGMYAFSPGGPLTPDRLVNVLELNLALDKPAAATTAAVR